ncbi:MAG TPA: tetratricopeptide repeat protein [Verrucomicrobiae bacterium]
MLLWSEEGLPETGWQNKVASVNFQISMNISRQFFRMVFCCCLVALAGCVSNQMPSIAELQPRAQNGDAVAQRELGEKFDFGYETKQDYVEAAKWYQMAANQGDAAAQNNLGSFYQYGLGVATNYSKAVELYKQSASQGDTMAQNNLGYMYDFGLGVTADKVAANSWYQRAAEQGYPEAMMNLGINYMKGEGIDRDLPQAYMWLDSARWLTQFNSNMRTKWRIRGVLDNLEQHMTPEQIREGERRSKEWSEDYIRSHKQ